LDAPPGIFGGFLKRKTDSLFLIKDSPLKEQIQKKISSVERLR
jgi:hypothetical protein